MVLTGWNHVASTLPEEEGYELPKDGLETRRHTIGTGWPVPEWGCSRPMLTELERHV